MGSGAEFRVPRDFSPSRRGTLKFRVAP
jgi:hypothetical protein